MAVMLFLPVLSFAREAIVPERDRLIQVDLDFFIRYRTILRNKLGSTSFDCGRVIFKPAFAPEYSVSVYSRQKRNSPGLYLVTYIRAEASLNDRMEPGIDPREAQAVNTRRIDCEIPTQTAEKVRQAWIGMLSGNQRPRPMRLEDAVRTTDATVVEFSVQRKSAETSYGQMTAAELPPGRKTGTLLQLAKLLITYCQAKPTNRSAAAANIDREATRLLEMLKHK